MVLRRQSTTARQRCQEALDTIEAHMLDVAAQIAEAESSGDSAPLADRLNTLDNGRIVLEQMVGRSGGEDAL